MTRIFVYRFLGLGAFRFKKSKVCHVFYTIVTYGWLRWGGLDAIEN